MSDKYDLMPDRPLIRSRTAVALAFLYVTAVLQSFAQISLQSILQQVLSAGPTVLRSAHAAADVNLFIGTYLLAGVGGGLLADRLANGFFVVTLAGSAIWTLGAALVVALPLRWPLFCASVALTAVGYGVVNPVQVVLVGAQLDSAAGEQKALAYLYLAYNCGNLAGEFGAPQLRQSLGLPSALAAILVAAALGLVFLLFGSPLYRRGAAVRVEARAGATVNSARLPPLRSPVPPGLLAAIVAPLPIFYTILYQQNSSMVEQADHLDRHIFGTAYEVPPDAMASLEDVFLLPLIPLLDSFIYKKIAVLREPSTDEALTIDERRRLLADDGDASGSASVGALGAAVAPLAESRHLVARMCVGMCASTLSMLSCALVEQFAVPRIASVWLQVPALLLLSVSEACVSVSGLQLVVSEFSRRANGKAALPTAVWLALGAVGAFIGAPIASLHITPTTGFLLLSGVGLIACASLSFAFHLTRDNH